MQKFPSEHDDPFAIGAFWQPEVGLQLSDVHRFESLQLSAVPAVQVPPWHVSLPLHTVASRHGVPFVTLVCVQPVVALHASVVHTFESLQLSGVPATQTPAWQLSLPLHTVESRHGVPFSTGVNVQPTVGLQVSVVHTLESLHVSGVPAVHVPLWHVSLPLHTVASAHDVPLATFTFAQPVAGLQLSVVHAFESLQLRGVPGTHVPLWQVSPPLHRFASAQDVPFVTCVVVQPVAGLQPSVVHTFESLQLSAVPAVHTPAWQVSAPLHRLASPQEVPLATTVLAHTPVLHTSSVHGFESLQSPFTTHAAQPEIGVC